MILDRNHVPYCYCGSVNKACNCICVWWYCDASIYRAGSTEPHGTCSFAGWILWIWYNPMCWSSVTGSRQSRDDEGAGSAVYGYSYPWSKTTILGLSPTVEHCFIEGSSVSQYHRHQWVPSCRSLLTIWNMTYMRVWPVSTPGRL